MSREVKLVHEFRDIVNQAVSRDQFGSGLSLGLGPIEYHALDRGAEEERRLGISYVRTQTIAREAAKIALYTSFDDENSLRRDYQARPPQMTPFDWITTSRLLESPEELQLAVNFARSPHLNREALKTLARLSSDEEVEKAVRMAAWKADQAAAHQRRLEAVESHETAERVFADLQRRNGWEHDPAEL